MVSPFNCQYSNTKMKIIHISDTHGLHRQLHDLPEAEVIVHSGDISNNGEENEVLDFLNWYIDLPYKHKLFVTGNHDICLWDADNIADLPDNVHFLQDRGCVIDGVKFYGLAYDHTESMIPDDVDVLITHEPPVMILDESECTHWGNALLRARVFQVKPQLHLFGHVHKANGTTSENGIIFSNAAMHNNQCFHTFEIYKADNIGQA